MDSEADASFDTSRGFDELAETKAAVFLTETAAHTRSVKKPVGLSSSEMKSPDKTARAKLLAKNRATVTDSDDSENENQRGGKPAAVRFSPSANKAKTVPEATPADPNQQTPQRAAKPKKPMLATTDFPGFNYEAFTFNVTSAIPIDHAAVEAIIESVTRRDPTLAHDRNVARFSHTKEFTAMTTGVFWLFTMKLKARSFAVSAQERILRGENASELQVQTEENERVASEVQQLAFHVAAISYGVTVGSMMARQGHAIETAISVRDSLFSRLPVLLAKTSFYLLTLVFSSSADHELFTPDLREDIFVLASKWITGVEPQNSYIAAHTQWPQYVRRKEAKLSANFDAESMVKNLDETAATAFHHHLSMLHAAGEFGYRRGGDLSSLRQGASFRRQRRGSAKISRSGGGDTSSVSSSMKPASVVVTAKTPAMTPRLGAPSDKGSVKGGGENSASGGTSSNLKHSSVVVPTLQDGCRWYEQGGMRGSLPVERTMQPNTPRQQMSLNTNSPLMAYYLELMGISTIDATHASQPIRWTVLAPLDKQAIKFSFEAHAKLVVKKAAAFCKENRRVLDATIETERRSVVAAQRAARFAAGKAKLAALHINALHSLKYPPTLELYESLRGRLEHAIDKAKAVRRGDTHITEVMAVSSAAIARVAEHVMDIPHPGRMELQRLSLVLFRAVRHLTQHTVSNAEERRIEAARAHIAYHSLSEDGAQHLERIFQQGKEGVYTADADLAALLQESAAMTIAALREGRLADSEDDELFGHTETPSLPAILGPQNTALPASRQDAPSAALPPSVESNPLNGDDGSGLRPLTAPAPLVPGFFGSRPPSPLAATMAEGAERTSSMRRVSGLPPQTDILTSLAQQLAPQPPTAERSTFEAAWNIAKEPKVEKVKQPNIVLLPDASTSVEADSAVFALPPQDMPTVTAYHTTRSSRASPNISRTNTSLDIVPVPPPPRVAVPKLRMSIAGRHSVRLTLDPTDTNATQLSPVQHYTPRVEAPKDPTAALPWWAVSSDDNVASEVVGGNEDVRRPATTPHHQRSTKSRQVAISGVGPVHMSVERQVAMKTTVALAAGTVPLNNTSLSQSTIRHALTPGRPIPASPSHADQGGTSRPSTQPAAPQTPRSARAVLQVDLPVALKSPAKTAR